MDTMKIGYAAIPNMELSSIPLVTTAFRKRKSQLNTSRIKAFCNISLSKISNIMLSKKNKNFAKNLRKMIFLSLELTRV